MSGSLTLNARFTRSGRQPDDGRIRVGINARLLHSPGLRGWSRYTLNLSNALAELGVKPVLLTDRALHPSHLRRLGGLTVRVSPPMNYLWWEQFWLPRQCAQDALDVLHTPFHFGLPLRSPCPRVLTLHDAIDRTFRDSPDETSMNVSAPQIKTAIHRWTARRAADHFITVSEYSRKQLMHLLDIPDSRITVTYEAADARFLGRMDQHELDDVRDRFVLDRPFVFYAGGWERRKNLELLVRAFAASGLEGAELVLAGGAEGQEIEVRRLGVSLGLRERLRLFGWVEDEDLPKLYRLAACFVYPSLHEGFGLQLCEAMACGCPVLAARTSCLPEVLSGGGDTFSVEDPSELASLLRRVFFDAGYRKSLQQRAAARSADLTWRRTAEATLEVYRDVVDGRAGKRHARRV